MKNLKKKKKKKRKRKKSIVIRRRRRRTVVVIVARPAQGRLAPARALARAAALASIGYSAEGGAVGGGCSGLG